MKMLLALALGLGCWLATLTAAAHDLTGTWSYKISKSWKKGPCPIGKDGPGKLKITQKGGKFTVVFLSGRVCRPKSMCAFKGEVSGTKYKGSNKAAVDSEGGTVKNTLELTAASPKAAAGEGRSVYSHPGGMTCRWGSKIALSR